MKNIFLLSLLLAFIFFSCSKEDDKTQPPTNTPAAAPVACFTVNKNTSNDSSEVFSFTNCSQNAVRYEWDFGDATYAPVANPVHYYNHNGAFIVRMNAYNSDDVMNSFIDTIEIGHYSLDKVIFRQTTTRFSVPFNVKMQRVSIFNIVDTVFMQSLLPLTVQLPDSSIYDFYSGPIQYIYREDSLPLFISRLFNVYASSLINMQFDTALSFGVYDTAKFTMYYKIKPW